MSCITAKRSIVICRQLIGSFAFLIGLMGLVFADETPKSLRELDQAIDKYLMKKVGSVAAAGAPTGDAQVWCMRQYQAALKQPDSEKLILRILYSHLKKANQLAQSTDVKVRRSALAMRLEAAKSAAAHLKDKWLVAKICDAYLLPHLADCHPSNSEPLSMEDVLSTLIYCYKTAGDDKGYLAGYKLSLLH